MKHTLKRTLSFLLALTMVLSLGLPAYAVGDITVEDQVVEQNPAEDDIILVDPVEDPAEEPADGLMPVNDKVVDVPVGGKIGSVDDPIGVVKGEVTEKGLIYPENDFTYEEAETGFAVEVHAPDGALPMGTEMRVNRMNDLANVQAAVDAAENLNGDVQLAADISFWFNGEEIEPAEGSKLLVHMSAPEIEGIAAPVVIHIPDGENAVPEVVDQVNNSEDLIMLNTVSFEAEKFSVYAVIDGGTADEARVAVNFYNNHLEGDKLIATYYVKNGDLLLGNGERDNTKSYIEDIVTDPGIGETLAKGFLFLGWTIDDPNANTAVEGKDYDTAHYGANYTIKTRAYDIDEVRDYLSKLNITEGMAPVNVYAIVVKIFVVTYLDNSGISLGSEDVLLGLNESSAPYTITMGYTPLSQDENFEGWNVADGTVANATVENEEGETVTAKAPYEVGTTMTISSDVTFSVYAPRGHWLVFEEVQKGATYNAPVFIYEGKKANEDNKRPAKSLPENMKCTGYSFVDWFEAQTGEDGAPRKDADGNVILKPDPFDWNTVITKRTVLYAKWNVAATATYTVIIWKQSVVDDKNAADADKTYDFGLSVQLTGTPDTTVAALVGTDLAAYLGKGGSSITAGEGDEAKTCDLDGFKQNTTQVAKANSGNKTIKVNDKVTGIVASSEKIAANGTTVINIYYDRELVTYNFYKPNGQYTRVTSPNWNDYSVYSMYYVKLGSNYYQVDTHNSSYTYAGLVPFSVSQTYRDTYTFMTVDSDGYFRELTWSTKYNTWYYSYYGNNYWYDEGDFTDIYVRVSASTAVYSPSYSIDSALTMTGLYGQKLSKYGYTWPSDYRWYTGTGSDASFDSIVELFSEDQDYYGRSDSLNTFVYHYLADSNGNWSTTPSHTVPTIIGNWMVFKNFQGFTPKEFRVKLPNGTASYQIGSSYNSSGTIDSPTTKYTSNGWTEWLAPNTALYYNGMSANTYGIDYIQATAGGIEFRYARRTYELNFMVGMFVNGKMEEMPTNAVAGLPKTVTDIAYEASLASYAKGGANYYDPFTNDDTKAANAQLAERFVFDGWYVDDACTQEFDFATATMPLDGVTVYGKWVQKQYRVFLHPNATKPDGTDDNALDWGSDSQSLNFRIDYGGTLSAPTPRREASGYEFIGWYTDEACKNAFNLETKMTDDTVTTPYAKTEFTDPLDKFGNVKQGETGYNSDITGYNGGDRFWITTKLDLYGKWGAILPGAQGITIQYDANGGSGAPDDSRYYKDNVDAVAQAATTPPAPTEQDPTEKQFLYWVMQKWDAETGSYKDIPGSKIYPGDSFTVLKSNAKIFVIEYDENDSTKIKTATYTVQLRAEYGPKKAPTDTHINFYANTGNGVIGAGAVESHTGLQVNEAILIPTVETYNPVEINHSDDTANRATNENEEALGLHNNGQVFLGWAKLEERADGKTYSYVTGNEISDTTTLTEADLWLKWVEATDTLPAHYEYNTSSVTKVAADEANPYQDLYAVWQRAFYVYHTSTGKVERVLLTNDVTEVNLIELVDTTKCLYGGYYKGYSLASDTFKADANDLQWTTPSEVTSFVTGSNTFSTLAGKNLVKTATDSGTKYTTTDAITDAVWTGAFITRGDKVKPGDDVLNLQKGEALVYYIKEVPIESYLRPNIKYTYSTTTHEIGTIWVVSGVDTVDYSKAGFIIGDTKYEYDASGFQDEIVFHPIHANDDNSRDIHCTYENQFTKYGITKGKLYYLCVYNNKDLDPNNETGDSVAILTANALVSQYWVTPDGATVTGKYARAYQGIESIDDLKPVPYGSGDKAELGFNPVGSTITFREG